MLGRRTYIESTSFNCLLHNASEHKDRNFGNTTPKGKIGNENINFCASELNECNLLVYDSEKQIKILQVILSRNADYNFPYFLFY